MESTGADPGLREMKKHRTREAIIAAAIELFERHGYAETTVPQIAAAAGISPRTFFGYFPRKQDVAFPYFERNRLALRKALVDERPAGSSFSDALRAWLADLGADQERFSSDLRRQRLSLSSPDLAAHNEMLWSELTETIVEGLAPDLGPSTGKQAEILAAGIKATLRILALALDDVDRSPEEPQELLDDALAFLQAGIDAVAARR